MNAKQLQIVRHTIGLNDEGRRRVERNYFVTDPTSDDGLICCELVAL